MNWATIENKWIARSDQGSYEIFYDQLFDLYFVRARKSVPPIEFSLYVGAFRTIGEAMMRAELFDKHPTKYPAKIAFPPKVREQVNNATVSNGSEVMKAVAELRAALSEKDMAALDEELKERGIGVQLVPDPAVPKECAVMVAKHPGEVKVYVFKVKGDEE